MLSHYCRVCNIQLNSCRQAKIHSEGKKHCKRVNFLRLCIESGEYDQWIHLDTLGSLILMLRHLITP